MDNIATGLFKSTIGKSSSMTLNEFKHWLDGYSEGINDKPTKVQWKKIKDKLDEVVPTAPEDPWIVSNDKFTWITSSDGTNIAVTETVKSDA